MLTTVERVLILRSADLLKDVGPRRLVNLADVAREIEITKGQTLYQERDLADALYMVVEGRVRIVAGERISEVGPGEAFGTWALVDEAERGHRAECLEDGRTLALHRDDFYDVAAGDLTLLQEVVRALARRLRALVSDQPHEARVEGEGVEKPEAMAKAEAEAAETAAEAPESPPPTPGAALSAAAVGLVLAESTTQEARRNPESAPGNPATTSESPPESPGTP